ncbi:MAG: hypothetical protein ACPHF4_15880, partial [Rubripirellula sp.]
MQVRETIGSRDSRWSADDGNPGQPDSRKKNGRRPNAKPANPRHTSPYNTNLRPDASCPTRMRDK